MTAFVRSAIIRLLKSDYPQMSESSYHWAVCGMLKSGNLTKVARNVYVVQNEREKPMYRPAYSDLAAKLISQVSDKYPSVRFTVFETALMNDFLNHLVALNTVFIQAEKDVSIFVFRHLRELGYAHLLYKPKKADYALYWEKDCIVVTGDVENMKKLRILLILCLTLAVTLPAASANSWNLNGQLLAMVEQTHDYDEYTGLVSDYNRKAATTHTILTSRYHNQLVAVDEVKDGWKDAIFSTTAVYQPSELEETGYPEITRTKNGFELAYPDIDERYYFELQHNNEGRTFYTLMEAQMGDVKVERIAEYIYQVTQGEESAVWPVGITLGSFNIHNMPKRGVEDVRRFNEANEGLQYFACLYPEVVSGQKSGKKSYAVYSAPDTSSYRAAKGKASVSTGDDYKLYLTVGDWSLIEYRVSLRTSRFGWAQLGNHGDETTNEIVHVPMMTAFDTYLTDDPNVSEYHQAELPAGTKLTALSHPDNQWAYVYVEATVDGKITRGFVPQRDVVFDDVELPDEEAKLVGSWQMEAGGEFWDTYLRLDADGKFYGSDCDGAQPYHGTWSVVQTPAGSNLYWVGDVPTIVFRCVNGTVYRYGVEVSDDYEVTEGDYCRSVSFIECQGGMGYVSYGVYDEGGSVITDENGKLILKELDVTDELNWGAYWEEEGNG